jgi:hypothetical protein
MTGYDHPLVASVSQFEWQKYVRSAKLIAASHPSSSGGLASTTEVSICRSGTAQ